MTIEVFNLADLNDARYDLLIFAVGYEARARFVAEKYLEKTETLVGYQFAQGHILSFEDNKDFLRRSDGLLMHATESLEETLRRAGENDFEGKRICLDVSSLNRGAMASLMLELLESVFFRNVKISVIYAVAEFAKPAEAEVDFLDFEPLTGFGGWTSNPEKPTVLLLGLGYETDHAIGALEFLDPSSAFAFFPQGSDKRFEKEVAKANKEFFDVSAEDRLVPYPVASPYQTYWTMRSLILSLTNISRVVLVPMGPKIFCSLCLICQNQIGDEISVWRASGHNLSEARDAQASGEITGYEVRRLDDPVAQNS